MNNTRISSPPETRFQFWVRWIITLTWACTIFLMSTGTYGGSFTSLLLWYVLAFLHISVTMETFHLIHHIFRKLGHLTEYCIFAMFLYHCFLNSNRTAWRAKTAGWAILGAALYSLTDELHQVFVPGRGPSLIDCGIDTTGASLAMAIVFLWVKYRSSRQPVTPDQNNLRVIST